MRIWTEAVTKAIGRHVANTGSRDFKRQSLIGDQIAAIAADTQTVGQTPTQTLGRILQELRDDGLLEFRERGTYRWLGAIPAQEVMAPSKGVFLLPSHAQSNDMPERVYAFSSEWLAVAGRTVDQWIVYRNASGYLAAAQVERIDPDPARADLHRAYMRGGSYIEFGRTVPLDRGERAADHVRLISNRDFDRILELGLVTDDDLLPRSDPAEEPIPARVTEEQTLFEGPVERVSMLVNRTVRSQQFRKRVLDVYGARCALTGMKLINGGGRAETEAAHIMSVEAGGPDAVNNGIALSGTIHWMFDRGLISLSDEGDILLSRAINDRESVERLIYSDRRARLPSEAAHRPHSHYLQWHRTECFHD